jgi:hypothetical protein
VNSVVLCATGKSDDGVGMVRQKMLLTDERHQLVNII